MGQCATLAEALETQVYLDPPGPRSCEAHRVARATGWERRPAMLPQFNLVVDAAYAETFDAALAKRPDRWPATRLQADRQRLLLDRLRPDRTCTTSPDAVAFDGEPRTLASLGLEAVEIEDRSGTTAYHVPEGILAVYDPTRPPPANGTRPEVSVLEVAPTLLQTLGVDPPSCMTRPRLLADLLPV